MNRLVNFFKALGEETRTKIILMLSRREMCVCEMMAQLNLSQPAVSHHIKILKQAGLVNRRRKGKWIFYSLNKQGFLSRAKSVQQLLMEPVSTKGGDHDIVIREDNRG